MFKMKKRSGDFHRNFTVLGLKCTHTERSDDLNPPFPFYLYVAGMRMGTKQKRKLYLAAIKYRCGIKEWYK
ncbi:hypothetical protein [Paenibacillus polymyxa]|uniref:Uncharacterized protein n=1 Tax=Paenibacillus polymyxa (strain SC2) TaxID=886882 RepID=A0A0D5ZCZ2_PAEPS|nr:hypothetical protein [Paenibacillus polymyxa]AKA44392.1 hypothetical protein PPSC2_28195 [Paenibacillus polymyxa SC2]WPQ59785.1 hypothetical protein SKN87_26210 [Paenibacillus polymyxa]